MTKSDVLGVLAEDFSASEVRDVAQILRDDFEYPDIKVSHPKGVLCDELEALVCKADLIEVLNANYEGWDEDGDESEEDSDDDEKGEEAE